MSIKKSGYIQLKIDGKLRAFKFGMNAFAKFFELRGIGFSDMESELSEKNPNMMAAMRDLIFAGAYAAAMSADKEIDFNQSMVGDWLDEMPQEDFQHIMDAITSSRVMAQGMQVETSAKKKTGKK